MSSSKAEQSVTITGSVPGAISPLTEQERQIHDDYEWCIHDPEVQRQYGGQVVAVHRCRVWGAGVNHLAALNAALQQPGCPPRHTLALAVVPPVIPAISEPFAPGT